MTFKDVRIQMLILSPRLNKNGSKFDMLLHKYPRFGSPNIEACCKRIILQFKESNFGFLRLTACPDSENLEMVNVIGKNGSHDWILGQNDVNSSIYGKKTLFGDFWNEKNGTSKKKCVHKSNKHTYSP